ncbi:MAG TPA: hypothetical protein VF459_11500 [Caulobacteraceae bacterium]
MLEPHEFTVGPFGSASPLSLILPRNKYEAAAVIGEFEGAPAAVVLTGDFAFRFFPSAGNQNWQGLIVPGIRIEVDEASLVDPDSESVGLGVVVRTDTRLVIRAMDPNGFGRMNFITLHGELAAAMGRAAFTTWQAVVGAGPDKRVVWRAEKAPAKAT